MCWAGRSHLWTPWRRKCCSSWQNWGVEYLYFLLNRGPAPFSERRGGRRQRTCVHASGVRSGAKVLYGGGDRERERGAGVETRKAWRGNREMWCHSCVSPRECVFPCSLPSVVHDISSFLHLLFAHRFSPPSRQFGKFSPSETKLQTGWIYLENLKRLANFCFVSVLVLPVNVCQVFFIWHPKLLFKV